MLVSEEMAGVEVNAINTPAFHRKPRGNLHIEFVPLQSAERVLKEADILGLWRVDNDSLRYAMRHPLKARILDPGFYLFAETHTYGGMCWHDFVGKNEKVRQIRRARDKYDSLMRRLGGRQKSYVFGTGPSVETAYKYDFSDGVRVVCNSIVKNDKMLEHVRPDILAFTDSVFHFGVSEYAEQFINDVVKVVRKYDTYCVTNLVGYSLICSQYPELENNVIGVPAKRFGGAIPLTTKRFKTRDYANILTRYMLPIAAGLSDEISLLGFDGRRPSEKYFWNHNPSTQYGSMDSTQMCHPAFFRDISYGGYYDAHCANLEKMIATFENAGKTIRSLGESEIPALRDRYW
jgi:hypothetical protein